MDFGTQSAFLKQFFEARPIVTLGNNARGISYEGITYHEPACPSRVPEEKQGCRQHGQIMRQFCPTRLLHKPGQFLVMSGSKSFLGIPAADHLSAVRQPFLPVADPKQLVPDLSLSLPVPGLVQPVVRIKPAVRHVQGYEGSGHMKTNQAAKSSTRVKTEDSSIRRNIRSNLDVAAPPGDRAADFGQIQRPGEQNSKNRTCNGKKTRTIQWKLPARLA